MPDSSAPQENNQRPEKLTILIKFTIAILVLIVGFIAPDIVSKINAQTKFHPLTDYCMLSTQACQQDNVSLLLNTDTIKPLKPNTLKVHWPQSKAERLELSMRGLEGELGTVRYTLKKMGNGFFEGQITLPVCTLDEMTWLGELTDGHKSVLTGVRMKQ